VQFRVQLSEGKQSSWLVGERVQLSVECQPVKRKLGGWCEMVANLGQLIEGQQSSQAMQGWLRRDGAIVELTVEKRSVVGYSQGSHCVSAGS
jgi:hypothetical protein